MGERETTIGSPVNFNFSHNARMNSSSWNIRLKIFSGVVGNLQNETSELHVSRREIRGGRLDGLT